MGKERKQRRSCLHCGKEVENLRNVYCNNKCQAEYAYHSYINRWKNGQESGNQGVKSVQVSVNVRRYLFERSHNACERCGWSRTHPITGRVPLTVHHKNGDSNNSQETNLELLCPNCHSLTENYGILNRGSGRKERYAGK